MAGLVGGDSDSSALTQESGDEAAVGTPRESVVTATDAGTEFGEEEDVEMKEPSPGWCQTKRLNLYFADCFIDISALCLSKTSAWETERCQEGQRPTSWTGYDNNDAFQQETETVEILRPPICIILFSWFYFVEINLYHQFSVVFEKVNNVYSKA